MLISNYIHSPFSCLICILKNSIYLRQFLIGLNSRIIELLCSVSYSGDIHHVMSFESNPLHSLVQNGHRFSKECVRFPLIIGVGKERCGGGGREAEAPSPKFK